MKQMHEYMESIQPLVKLPLSQYSANVNWIAVDSTGGGSWFQVQA